MRDIVCDPAVLCDGIAWDPADFAAYAAHPGNYGRVLRFVIAPVADEIPCGHDGGVMPPLRPTLIDRHDGPVRGHDGWSVGRLPTVRTHKEGTP